MNQHLDDIIKHETIVKNVVARLQRSGRYDGIQVHYEYGKKGRRVECDIVTFNERSIHYYEIKCRTNKDSFNHASRQFQRFKDTHPLLNPKFIYITEDTCKRVYK